VPTVAILPSVFCSPDRCKYDAHDGERLVDLVDVNSQEIVIFLYEVDKELHDAQ
jgi:hypothetical protein